MRRSRRPCRSWRRSPNKYEKDVAVLKSHEELERLQAIYGYYIDKGLWDQAAALFAKDGTYEFGQRGVYVGPEHIKKALGLFGPQGLEPGQLNNYMMLAADHRRGARQQDRQGAVAERRAFERNGKGRWGGGVYENTYVNDHGTWKFQSLHYYVTQESDYDKGWGNEPFPMEGPSKEFPPDRPPTVVYKSLPGVYFPPYHFNNPVTDKPVHYGPDKADQAGAETMNAALCDRHWRPAVALRSLRLGLPEPAGHAATDTRTQLVEIQKSLDALGLKIERLQGRNQVEKIQRAYGYYVDKAQWPGIADLFTEDGTYEIGGRGVFVGPKRVLEYLVVGLGPIGMGSRYDQMIDHQQFQGVVHVSADGKRAWGRWTAFVMSSVGG